MSGQPRRLECVCQAIYLPSSARGATTEADYDNSYCGVSLRYRASDSRRSRHDEIAEIGLDGDAGNPGIPDKPKPLKKSS